MTIRDISSSKSTNAFLLTTAAINAEMIVTEENQQLAKKRASKKMLTTQAPTLSGQTAPQAGSTTPPSPTPPVPSIAVLATSSKPENDEDAKREMALELFWKSLQATALENGLLQDIADKTALGHASLMKDIPAPKFTPEQRKTVVDMVSYMTAILIASVDQAQSQSKVSDDTNTMSQNMVTLSQQEVQKAQKELADEIAREHESFWQKLGHAFAAIGHLFMLANPATLLALLASGGKDALKNQWGDFTSNMGQAGAVFQDLVSAVMILGGAATGNIGLVVMGTAMFAMSASGGQNDLDNAVDSLAKKIGGGLGVKILLDLAVAVAEAVVLGGISSVVSAGAEAVSADSAEAAGKAGGDAAGAAAGASVAAGGAASVATAEESSALEKFINALKKRLADALTKAGMKQLLAKSIMTAGTTGLWSDLVRSTMLIADAAGAKTGKDKEDEVAAIGGAVLGMAATLGSAALETGESGASALMKRLEKSLGEKPVQALTNSFKAFRALVTLLAAGQDIQTGVNELAQADSIDRLAKAQSAQNLYADLIQVIDSMIASNTTTGNAIHSDFAAINNRWDSIFVTPWNA